MASLLAANASAYAVYQRLAATDIYAPVPSLWLNTPARAIVGGNLLCGSDVQAWTPINGLYMGFSITNMCGSIFSESIRSNVPQQLAALGCISSTFDLLPAVIDTICSLDTFAPANCTEHHSHAVAFLRSYLEPILDETFMPLVTDASMAVTALNVSIAQYVVDTTTNVTTLALVPLLDATDLPWQFYGWCLLFEWVAGHRDVVRFAGDRGTATVLSAATQPLSMAPDPNALPRSFSFLCLYCVQYVTVTLIVVGAAVVVSAVYHRGHMEAMNLFCVNRVVGLVWVGRPVIFLRSLTAIWLLNTSPLPLVVAGAVTHFAATPLVWYKTLLATSELTWFVYVLNDI
ncbi:hypothetical protein ACHHYP_06666, partial [Achlya hypogyna]